MITRGSILQCEGKFYMLVRCEVDTMKDQNGNPVTGTDKGRYNLINLSTGKARVSDPGRLLIYDADVVPLSTLVTHFNLPLVDTGLTANDVNFEQVITEALAHKQRRLNTPTPAIDPLDEVIRSLMTQIRANNTYSI